MVTASFGHGHRSERRPSIWGHYINQCKQSGWGIPREFSICAARDACAVATTGPSRHDLWKLGKLKRMPPSWTSSASGPVLEEGFDYSTPGIVAEREE